MTSIQTAIERMEAEYREMPGLMLTARQAERLLGLDRNTCELAISALMRRRFLTQTAEGTYLRQRAG
jgi:hypothetical protein